MAKLPLKTLSSGYFSTQLLNDNFQKIQTALDNTLSRDGTSPNSLLADLDVNGHSLYNIDNLSVQSITVGDSTIEDLDVVLATINDAVVEVEADRAEVAANTSTVASNTATVLDNAATSQANADNALLSELQAFNYKTDAEAAAVTATSQSALTQSSASSVLSAVDPVLSAQAQTNALLGLGIGSSVIDTNGHLIMGYNEATVTSLAFDANGHLVITY